MYEGEKGRKDWRKRKEKEEKEGKGRKGRKDWRKRKEKEGKGKEREYLSIKCVAASYKLFSLTFFPSPFPPK